MYLEKKACFLHVNQDRAETSGIPGFPGFLTFNFTSSASLASVGRGCNFSVSSLFLVRDFVVLSPLQDPHKLTINEPEPFIAWEGTGACPAVLVENIGGSLPLIGSTTKRKKGADDLHPEIQTCNQTPAAMAAGPA